MFAWVVANAGTIIVLLVIAGYSFLVARKLIRDRRKGKTSCGCGCANCAMHGMCHKMNKPVP